MWNFGTLAPFRNHIAKCFYGPSITHKNDHLAKNWIKIVWTIYESSNFGIWLSLLLAPFGWIYHRKSFCWLLLVEFITERAFAGPFGWVYHKKSFCWSLLVEFITERGFVGSFWLSLSQKELLLVPFGWVYHKKSSCWSLLLDFITETGRDRGNPSTYY